MALKTAKLLLLMMLVTMMLFSIYQMIEVGFYVSVPEPDYFNVIEGNGAASLLLLPFTLLFWLILQLAVIVLTYGVVLFVYFIILLYLYKYMFKEKISSNST